LYRLLSVLGLRFPDIEMETRFRKDFGDTVLPVQRAGLILGLIVMAIFTIRDVQLSATIGQGPLMFRLFIIIPFFALGLLISFMPWVRRHHQLFFFTFAVGLIVVIHILYTFAQPTGPTDPRYGFRTMSSMLLIVGVAALSGLRFEYAVTAAIGVIVAWFWSTSSLDLERALWAPTLAQLVAMTLLAGGVSYWIERSHRLQFAARQALHDERALSERLLSYSMPSRALARLKKGDQQIADAFLEAVVIFVDLAGFTDLSKRIGPRETVRILDHVFTQFDDIIGRYGLERVKTMGDGYIAIGGTGDRRQDDLRMAASAARDMVDAVAHAAKSSGLPLALRVGMHVGPVIGGVIGRERPTYDYWGDTLNIASRLETTSEPGRVHCSEAVYWRLRHTWTFTERGLTELKGYTSAETYYLDTPLSTGAAPR
jgi:class 3 adenylate cyclase